MKFNFKIQQYQTDAVENTVNVFAGQPSRDGFQYRRDIGKKAAGTIIYDDEYTGFRNNDIEQTDQVADNFEQIFNAYSKDTIRRIL